MSINEENTLLVLNQERQYLSSYWKIKCVHLAVNVLKYTMFTVTVYLVHLQ